MVNGLRKDVLDSNPSYLPDFTKPSRIECDASSVGCRSSVSSGS